MGVTDAFVFAKPCAEEENVTAAEATTIEERAGDFKIKNFRRSSNDAEEESLTELGFRCGVVEEEREIIRGDGPPVELRAGEVALEGDIVEAEETEDGHGAEDGGFNSDDDFSSDELTFG